jgi:hypothetical protein
MVSGMNFTHHISRGFRDIGGYTPSITHTMAHELGLGLFGLDHIFSGAYGIKKGATHNLMDYTEKNPNDALSYHEWNQINLPLPSWSTLSRAEEDMNRKGKERQEKAWETAWQIYEEEKQKGRNIVYYTLRNTIKQINAKDGIGTQNDVLSLNYISGQIKFQNNLVQNIWFDNLLNNRMVDNKVEFTQSSSLYTFESELELGDFILYEAGDGSVQFCRIPSVSIQSILDEIETVEYYLKGGSEQLWISRDVIDKLMGGIDALSKISKKIIFNKMATKEEIKLIFERVEELYLLISAELDKFQNECQYSDLEKNHAKYYSKEFETERQFLIKLTEDFDMYNLEGFDSLALHSFLNYFQREFNSYSFYDYDKVKIYVKELNAIHTKLLSLKRNEAIDFIWIVCFASQHA